MLSEVAHWLSFITKIVGVLSIAAKLRWVTHQEDVIHALRLGWHQSLHVFGQHVMKLLSIKSYISPDLPSGLCGQRTVCLSRLPRISTAQTTQSIIETVIHPVKSANNHELFWRRPSAGWNAGIKPMMRNIHKISHDFPSAFVSLTTRTRIPRTTLMTLLCVTNARSVVRYSDGSGYRAAFAAYCGEWRVEWPIGKTAQVYFCAHDLHTTSEDVYPTMVVQRVDKCIQIFAGVIDSRPLTAFSVAFPGRKRSGRWVLQYAVNGFSGAHSGRHLYNMMGGHVNGVDYLYMKALQSDSDWSKGTVLCLPSAEADDSGHITLHVPQREVAVLNEALDRLPWAFLSWSTHRGLRDILVAFSKERMDRYRSHLAETLRHAVAQWPERLIYRGWNHRFVEDEMADIAASAVLAGQGNSGDAVRVVTDIAFVLWDCNVDDMDETHFWRCATPEPCSSALSPPTVVALVKCFVLEWSRDLDYQMYHDLPRDMYLE